MALRDRECPEGGAALPGQVLLLHDDGAADDGGEAGLFAEEPAAGDEAAEL